MQETLSAVNIALAFIKRQRKDTAYQSFYSLVVLKAKKNTDDPVLPHYRRPPRHLDVTSAPHSFAPPEKYYRVKYYEGLDFAENEISRRFAQGSLEASDSIEIFLIKSANVNSSEKTCEVPDIIMNIYSKDIDITRQNSRHKCYLTL